MIFFHKYYLYNLFTNNVDLDITKLTYLCIACFFVGLKSSDIKFKLIDVLEYSFKGNVLCQKPNDADKEKVLSYEFQILNIIQFDITNYGLTYKKSYYDFETTCKSLKAEFKDPSISEKIKDYYIALIRYSFIFPFFLKYEQKVITLSCTHLLLEQFIPKYQTIFSLKEYSEFQNDIIECSNLLEQFLQSQRMNTINNNPNTNVNNINNINNEQNRINIGIIREINSTNANNI